LFFFIPLRAPRLESGEKEAENNRKKYIGDYSGGVFLFCAFVYFIAGYQEDAEAN